MAKSLSWLPSPTGPDRPHPVVAAQLDPGTAQGRRHGGTNVARHGSVHQDRLRRIADTEAVCLGVHHDVERHGQIRRRVHVDVAVAVAVEHVGHGGVLEERGDQRRTARGE